MRLPQQNMKHRPQTYIKEEADSASRPIANCRSADKVRQMATPILQLSLMGSATVRRWLGSQPHRTNYYLTWTMMGWGCPRPSRSSVRPLKRTKKHFDIASSSIEPSPFVASCTRRCAKSTCPFARPRVQRTASVRPPLPRRSSGLVWLGSVRARIC